MTSRNRTTTAPLPGWLPFGSITDVAGVTVGHHQRVARGWQTGTTVVLTLDGATPGVDVRGGGPGTRETDALHPHNLIEQIHGLCLTGGSAYGLAAADGVVSFLESRGLGFGVGTVDATPRQVVPVVPAAVIFDLGRGGAFDRRPDAHFGWRAARTAKVGQHRWGSVGAGTGARAAGLQGGVGTSSKLVSIEERDGATVSVTVGALAVVNANGSVIDSATGVPWDLYGLSPWTPSVRELRAIERAMQHRPAPRLNTTIGVVATSARLTKSEVSKLATVAHDGLARAIRPAHSMFDGDTIFGLATGVDELPVGPVGLGVAGSRHGAFNQLLVAAADTFASACVHAVLAASTVGELPAYRDLCSRVPVDV